MNYKSVQKILLRKHLSERKLETTCIVFIVLLGVVLRFYKLDQIPAEIWGDIVVGMDFMKEIFTGKFPFYFVLGNGPLFFYFASFLSIFIGFNFLTLKILSAFFGVVLVVGTYLFSKELFGKKTAFLAAFLMAVSKWPVLHSRWGLMNILVPTFISFVFYFFLKYVTAKKNIYLFLCGLLLGVGLYIYPAFIIVPPTFYGISFIYLINRKHFINKNQIMAFLLSVVVFLLISIPYMFKFKDFGFNNSQSYFGSKIFVSQGGFAPDFFSRLYSNTVKHLLMFNIRGDVVFRVNPTLKPELDIISGAFFVFGVIYLLLSKTGLKKKLIIFIPFVFFQLPSLLVINFPMDVPNSTRSIGILPFLYLIVAIGMVKVLEVIKSEKGYYLTLILILSSVVFLNTRQIFIDYPYGLPNHNVPFGRIIAGEVDNLPKDITPIIYSCCWGDWGQPEIGAISYAMKKERNIVFVPENADICGVLELFDKYFLYISPIYGNMIKDNRLCNQNINVSKNLSKYNDVIYVGAWNY